MHINRQQAEQHLRAGRPVAFRARSAPPRTITPPGGRRAPELPDEDVEGEYVLLRDEQGDLTHAGMEHVIAEGGSVMLNGTVIESVDDLPDEAQLVAGKQAQEEALARSLDSQIAELSARRARVGPRVEPMPQGPHTTRASEMPEGEPQRRGPGRPRKEQQQEE